MNVIFISQCQKKALGRTRMVLDAFANRIGDNAWQTAITEDGLTMVKKLLRQTASKNTAVSCHRIKTRNRTELEWIVGNQKKFNELGYVPVNFTNQELIMDKLPIETQHIFANTHGQVLSQHLFAVGFLAYHIIKKIGIDDDKNRIAKSAFIAGILHDIGKLDPKFQEWVTKKQIKHTDELDEILLPDDGVHINSSDKGFSKFSFDKYPRHQEISWLLANSLLKDENSLNPSQFNQIYHAIYWHHTRPYRTAESEKFFDNARGIDKKWLEQNDIKAITDNIVAVLKEVKLLAEQFNGDDFNTDNLFPKWQYGYQLTSHQLPNYKEYDNLADKIAEFTKDIRPNALNNIVRSALITADRLVSKMDKDDLMEYLSEGSLLSALDDMDFANPKLANDIQTCLMHFENKFPNSERNQKQSQIVDKILEQTQKAQFEERDNISVLQGPAGCGKTKIALEWALKSNAQRIIWICPRVQVCLGILHDLTSSDYLPNTNIEILTGEYKKICRGNNDLSQIDDTNPKDYFTGDIVITTIDQIVSQVISHQKITGLIKFMQSHIVFDEFHELIPLTGLNLLFAELIECKKFLKHNANTLLVSATPNDYFVNEVLELKNSQIVRMNSFNQADYQIIFNEYDDNKQNPLLNHQIKPNKKSFVISNTAQDAQIGFLLNQNNEHSLLLHSKYTRQDKADIFHQVFECFKQNGNGQYNGLRSGPIVQASLNISCDEMFTDLTCAENWLQRLGRLNRFGNTELIATYTTVLPKSMTNKKQSHSKAKFLNRLFLFHSTMAWYQFLIEKLADKNTLKLDELYRIYQEFYNDENCKKEVEKDIIGCLKKSIAIINDKLTDPISMPTKKSKDGIIKISSNSLRGENVFVQMAICDVNFVDNQFIPKISEQYAYDEETNHSEINIGLTEDINRIQGGRLEYRNDDKNLVAFMQKKHHNIKEVDKVKNTWELLKLARSPQNPIYLSYIPSDLEPIGGERERHEFAMYYVRTPKQMVGTMPIHLLQNPQTDDELAD